MSRRRLSSEDRELWERVRRSATPLHPARPLPPAPKPSPVSGPPPVAPAPTPLTPFRLGEAAPRPPVGLPSLALRAPLRMDANTFARMARGRLRPEARLDLHGMTLAEAHGEVVRFVLHARARGLRLVLLITGKGRGDEVGALRRDVPRWLALPPLAPAVLQVAPAHRSHGGEGALYVYLRA